MKTLKHLVPTEMGGGGCVGSVNHGGIGKGLLMAPKSAGFSTLVSKHKRAGSTGTTGDESYTTDEEDLDTDEPDCSIKEHVTKKLYSYGDYGSNGDIATITDKISPLPMHRNSSDSSVYSDIVSSVSDKCAILDTCDLDSWKGVSSSPAALVGQNVAFGCCAKGRAPQVACSDCGGARSSSSSGAPDSGEGDWGRSVIEVKEQMFTQLQDELKEAHQELRLRDEEVIRLSRIRQDVETELEDLTASLFQEAHNMVREANEKQAAAERALKESQMKVDVLTAEVAALKTLVLTSTPSRPNPHLHPQIDLRGREDGGVALFTKKHRRSPSHFNLKYGRENSPPESPVKENGPSVSFEAEVIGSKDGLEVDPNIHKDFLAWKQQPTLNKDDVFIQRIYAEDINLCLSFNNAELSEKVAEAVESGTIFIEAVSDKTKTMFPKKCALLEVPRQCAFRMKIGDQETWHSISMICRNRIIAVCDFLNYLKYIERGLVKSSVHEIYWEITRLRKDMVLARLGLALAS